MSYWKTEHFKALQQDWYKRLQESGFQDIETFVGEELELKDIRPRSDYRHRDQAAKELYYVLVGRHVHNHHFKCDVHRKVLMWHADGKTNVAICDELLKQGTPRHKRSVKYIIRRYLVLWGIRKYTPKQLNKKVKKQA